MEEARNAQHVGEPKREAMDGEESSPSGGKQSLTATAPSSKLLLFSSRSPSAIDVQAIWMDGKLRIVGI